MICNLLLSGSEKKCVCGYVGIRREKTNDKVHDTAKLGKPNKKCRGCTISHTIFFNFSVSLICF